MKPAKNAVVLGAGMVGTAMALDLVDDAIVTVADASDAALARVADRSTRIRTVKADLSSAPAIRDLVTAASADVVCGALSSRLGLQTLRAVIETGKPYVDISFMADDALALDAHAKEHGACCVVDCGVAPGTSNLLAGYAASVLACERLDIFVGGLPQVRTWPFEYKAPFAPSDVIEEYVRPAREVEDGKIVVKEALSEPELVDFPGVGTLEAFNTDGLRSLTTTLSIPDMSEKTLRYPGHIALMRVLREIGFFSADAVDIKGASVRPLDVTAALVFPKWSYDKGEADLTVLRVAAVGKRKSDGKRVRMQWDMLDRYDAASDFRSMSRTTGYPATAIARLMLAGKVTAPGVVAPEALGPDKSIVDAVLADLEKRGIRYHHRVDELG